MEKNKKNLNKIFWITCLAVLICFVMVSVFKIFEYKNTIFILEKIIDEQQNEIVKYQNLMIVNESDASYNLDKSLELSDQFYSNLEQLNEFVDYAIQKYCDQTQIVNNYKFNIIKNMLHEQTEVFADADYSFDLAKEIHQDLVNRKYFFRIEGSNYDLIITIDTYRMKIFVYVDKRDGSLFVVDGGQHGDVKAYENNYELEDCIISDWDDPYIGEYWSFAAEGWENLIIPEDMEYNQELYGMVIYALQRYCKENQINEIFTFDVNKDIVSLVTNMVFTVKIESDNTILYMDLDCRRNKFHIYEVES